MAREWEVLLLGGASGSGKSRLAAELARTSEVTVVEIDDLHAAVLAMTGPAEQPVLHFWTTTPDPFALSEAEIAALHEAVCRVFEPAVAAVVADRLDSSRAAIVEGDYLLPAAADRIVRDHPGVAALFVMEADPEQIARNFADREPDAGDQSGRARISTRRNAAIAAECRRLGIPLVAARPWADVLSRALAALA